MQVSVSRVEHQIEKRAECVGTRTGQDGGRQSTTAPYCYPEITHLLSSTEHSASIQRVTWPPGYSLPTHRHTQVLLSGRPATDSWVPNVKLPFFLLNKKKKKKKEKDILFGWNFGLAGFLTCRSLGPAEMPATLKNATAIGLRSIPLRNGFSFFFVCVIKERKQKSCVIVSFPKKNDVEPRPGGKWPRALDVAD